MERTIDPEIDLKIRLAVQASKQVIEYSDLYRIGVEDVSLGTLAYVLIETREVMADLVAAIDQKYAHGGGGV